MFGFLLLLLLLVVVLVVAPEDLLGHTIYIVILGLGDVEGKLTSCVNVT